MPSLINLAACCICKVSETNCVCCTLDIRGPAVGTMEFRGERDVGRVGNRRRQPDDVA